MLLALQIHMMCKTNPPHGNKAPSNRALVVDTTAVNDGDPLFQYVVGLLPH